MFWEILDEPRRVLLRDLVEKTQVEESYLAGGTALALQIGHRESYDFDWFTPVEFDPHQVVRQLEEIGETMVSDMKRGTLHAIVRGMRVTWLWYPNPLLEPLLEMPSFPEMKMASLLDIGLMKWSAISGRGAMRDFVDLYMICEQGYPLTRMKALLADKYPKAKINYYHMVKSLSYFEDAENDLLPKMLIAVDWQQVKDYYRQQQKILMDELMNDGTLLLR